MLSDDKLQSQLEKDILTCAICCSQYKDPRALKCQHTFCSACLKAQLASSKTSQLKVQCAVCRKTSTLNKNGVDGLPSNLVIKGLLQIVRKNKVASANKKRALQQKVVNPKNEVESKQPSPKEGKKAGGCCTSSTCSCREVLKDRSNKLCVPRGETSEKVALKAGKSVASMIQSLQLQPSVNRHLNVPAPKFVNDKNDNKSPRRQSGVSQTPSSAQSTTGSAKRKSPTPNRAEATVPTSALSQSKKRSVALSKQVGCSKSNMCVSQTVQIKSKSSKSSSLVPKKSAGKDPKKKSTSKKSSRCVEFSSTDDDSESESDSTDTSDTSDTSDSYDSTDSDSSTCFSEFTVSGSSSDEAPLTPKLKTSQGIKIGMKVYVFNSKGRPFAASVRVLERFKRKPPGRSRVYAGVELERENAQLSTKDLDDMDQSYLSQWLEEYKFPCAVVRVDQCCPTKLVEKMSCYDLSC